MTEVSTDIINKAVYELCYRANICLNKKIYNKLHSLYLYSNNLNEKKHLKFILQNAKTAYDNKMPLCQDTGQVIVFLEIGQNIHLEGEFIEDVINSAVEKCYKDNYFRKSTVKNAIFDRTNTKSNTPCIIYTKYIKEDIIKINVLIKGAGSENKSKLEMMLPTSTLDEVIEKCSEMILSAGTNACPPMFIGIGLGGTAEKALLASKEALVENLFTEEETKLSEAIKNKVNSKAPYGFKNIFVSDVKIKTLQTHIASLPIGITINCHSDRFASAEISNNNIKYDDATPDFINIEEETSNLKEIHADDTEGLTTLKEGDEFLLTGEIYVARDMAHKKLIDLLNQNKALPFDITNKIIFYAGPCPNKPGQIIGSIGPTTAGRMDKYAIDLYKKGLFATIGKGTRSEELKNYLLTTKKKYFSIQGGIAALLANRVKKSEIIAFEELGTEAIYKIQIEKFPLKVEISNEGLICTK